VGDVRRLIVFDLDGTLIDSRRDLAESANELIVERGGRPLPHEAIGAMVGEGAAVLVRRALAAAGIEETADALPRFLDIYSTHLLDHTRLYPGIEEILRRAHAAARTAVLTNKPYQPSDRILQGLGVRGLFDVVCGGDGPYPRKPDPAGLLAVMTECGADTRDTLLVGDSPIDHETAARARVRCCIVTFDSGFQPFPAERLRGDEWIARDVEGLRVALDRFTGGD
jgi:phosphoglycolate phosphatase